MVVLSMLTLFVVVQATTAFAFAPKPPPPPPPPPVVDGPEPGLRVDRTYAPDGKGYLEYIVTDSGHKQPFLHLEGSGYEMGFQQGYLIPEKCAAVASNQFFTSIAVGNLASVGLPKDLLLKPVVELLLGQFFGDTLEDYPGWTVTEIGIMVFKHIALLNETDIPTEYIAEMQGIAHGAQARGVDLTYADVLLLNVGFDAFMSAGYPIVTTTEIFSDIVDLLQLSCNAHILDGNATKYDNLYFGRDFMFGGDGFTDNPVIIETCGDGGRNRVVNVSVAGMVGCIAAMNDKGLGIGMDMVPSADCTPGYFGMGCLLTARWVMERADELPEAVSMIKNSKRGVSWLYAIADGQGQNRGGVSLEVSAHSSFARYLDYTKPWWYALMPDYQKETYPDALIQTNHYITPDMNILAPTFQDAGSLSRYDGMVNLLHRDYGTYDYNKALDLINWMYDAYGEGPNSNVGQSVTLFDLTNLKMTTFAGPKFGQGATTLIME